MKVYAVMNHVFYETGTLMAIFKHKNNAMDYCKKQTKGWSMSIQKNMDEEDVLYEGSTESYEIVTMEVE